MQFEVRPKHLASADHLAKRGLERPRIDVIGDAQSAIADGGGALCQLCGNEHPVAHERVRV